jgi:hypothetical protein
MAGMVNTGLLSIILVVCAAGFIFGLVADLRSSRQARGDR